MDLAVTTETLNNDRDYRWLASSHLVNATQPATALVSDFVEATHYPDGYLKRGLILARDSGTGLWGPYEQDGSSDNATAAGIVIDGFRLSRDFNGAFTSTNVAGAVVLAGIPLQIFVDFLPGLLLADKTTAYTPVAADLPAAMIAVVQ